MRAPSTSTRRAAAGCALAGALLCAAFGLSSCAHVEPPSGGPEDKARPVVAAAYPAPGAVKVPRDARVIFQFSEWIDRGAARGQVLISPPPPGRLRVSVDGDRVIAQLPAGAFLRAGATYTAVAMGGPTGLKDLHGNTMARPFTLRFSTGPSLDSASLGGRVVGGAGRGNLVVALYRMDDRARAEARALRDTGFRAGALPEPWRELPAYLAAADSSGAFLADAAASGDYAVMAFEDVNGDLGFDAGLEPVAMGETRLTLRPDAPAQTLRLAPLDTVPLRIAEVAFEAAPAPGDSASGTVSGWVSVKFTRDPHPAKAAASRFKVLPDSGSPIPVEGAAWSPERSAWLLSVPPLKPGVRYRAAMRGRPDFSGRDGLNDNDTSAVFVPESPDKAAREKARFAEWKVYPVAPPGPSGLLRAGYPRAGAAQAFASALPLTGRRWEKLAARLEARLGNDTTSKPLRPRRDGLLTFSFDLPRPLREGDRLELRLRAAADPVEGDSLPRTLYAGFMPDTANFGWLRATAPADRRGWTFWASPASGEGAEEIPLERAGGDTLRAFAPLGIYRVQAFLDRDKDGVRDPGSLRPWIAQEPYALIADTVRVQKTEP